MHLFNCTDPVAVKDHDGKTRYVPCGKCDYCRYVRSLNRIERSTNELRKHKYAVLVTLTYHDAFLPLVTLDSQYNLMYYSSHDDLDSLCNTDDGLVSDYCVPNEYEANLFHRISLKYGGVPVLYKPDVQSFLKRLRSSICYQLCNNDKLVYNEQFKITYCYCGEYGPTTYRPHYHLLLMFDTPELLGFLSKSLYSLWSLGHCTQRIVNTTTEDAHYCAQYANSINRLPSLYQQKMVASFFETSRNGSYGFATVSPKEVERVFRSGSPEIIVQDMLSGENKYVPLPIYLARKLFPVFSGYSLLSNYDVLRLLKLCELPHIKSPKDLVYELNRLYYDLHDSQNLSVWFKVFLSSGPPLSLLETSAESYDFLIESEKHRRILNLANSIYYCKNAYDRVCSTFGVDLSDAVACTFTYLDNQQKYKLRQQLEFEDTFFEDHPEWLIYLDSYSAPPPLSEMCSTEFGDVLAFVEHSISHSHKNKRQYEYLAAHPEYSYVNKFDDRLSSIYNDF